MEAWGKVKTEQQEVSIRDGEPLKLKCHFTQIPNFSPGKLKGSWQKEIENIFLKVKCIGKWHSGTPYPPEG